MNSFTEKFNVMWERKKKAHHEINALAQGKREFQMSIPARDTDSDLTLQAPIDDLETAIEIAEKTRGALDIAFEALQYYQMVENQPGRFDFTATEACEKIDEIMDSLFPDTTAQQATNKEELK